MAIRIVGIRITLDDAAAPVAALASIGLRNTAGNSEILIAENSVVGAPEWAANALSEDGIGPYEIGFESIIGGAVAKIGDIPVSLINTGKLQDEFDTRGISLQGMKAERVEITGTTVAVIATGKIERIEWDAVKYSFVIKADANCRDAAMLKEITTDDYPYSTTQGTIPASFGELRSVVVNNKSIPIYAKAVRVAAGGKPWSSGQSSGFRDPLPINLISYPIKAVVDETHYTLMLVASYAGRTGSIIESDIVGKHLFVVYDAPVSSVSNKGFYRKITAASSSLNLVTLTIEHPLPKMLATTSIVQILDVQRQFVLDCNENKAQIKDDGSALDTNPFVYLYDEKYDRLPESLADVDAITKTVLSVDSKSIEGDIDEIKSCVSVPFKSVKLFTDPTITIDATAFNKVVDGYFKTEYAGPSALLAVPDVTLATDRNGSTPLTIDAGMVAAFYGHTDQYAAIIECEMPDIPENITFNKLYAGLNATMDIAFDVAADNYAHKVDVYYKFWDGTQNVIKQITFGPSLSGSEFPSVTFKNLPTWHYSENPPSNDGDYYKHTTPLSSVTWPADVTGYKEAEILQGTDSTDNNNYGSLSSIIIVFRFAHTVSVSDLPVSYRHTVNIFEAGLMFYVEKTISDAVYTPNKGRIFNDTWGTRKTAADMMALPRHFLEHACRLQRYAESEAEPTGGWGKAYATTAKIRTSGNGSFDTGGMGVSPAFQLFDSSEGTTDSLKKILCREYNQLSWVDKDGYECVKDIALYATAPAETITFGNIIDKESIVVTPPDASEIYCQPIIKFNKNYATGEYQSKFEVTRVADATYTAGNVKGMAEGGFAQYIWARCHALWLRCRTVNEMPSELSDMVTANGKDSELIAMVYLLNLMQIMGLSRITFNLPSDLVSTWDVGHRFNLVLPHQTAGATVECLVKSLRFNSKAPYDCEVEAYMIVSADIPVDFVWQETFATGTVYQETYATGTTYQETF